tara:strand:- start:610 stop:1110 length:501 start_codon:yes stop_codon:yes gene_type:complete
MKKDYSYYEKFPAGWIKKLREELHLEFGPDFWSGGSAIDGKVDKLPPVVMRSFIGKIASFFPSKPQGITLWGTIYFTPHYPEMSKKFRELKGQDEAFIYEFGMYAHETYHAVDQKIQGRLKWFIKYILRLIKTPNAYKHPMEQPAYAFQNHLKRVARESLHLDKEQ